MTEKRSFPDDWSELSYGQVAGNILYLLEHYKDYEIKRINKNNILIDRNIRLSKVKFQENAFIINGRMFEEITKQHSIYDKLEKIFEECEQEIEIRDMLKKLEKKKTRERNRRIWWDSNKAVVFPAGYMVIIALVVLSGLLVAHYKLEQKKQKIENAVKQYEKTLPNYQEYEQVKQQIAQYRDSLERAR